MAFVLFSAMRNEGPFLFDWIAYHRAIGFDRICIVTNDCDDGSNALLAKLHDAGIVDHIDQVVREQTGPQRAAVNLLDERKYLAEGDWAIFLDADEYLNIRIGAGQVADLSNYLEQRQLAGMLINWRLFGDSGQQQFNGTYISADYTGCETPSDYTQFKTLFKVGDIGAGFSGELHRCRVHPGVGKLTDFITGSGEVLGAGGPGQPKRRHLRWLQTGEDVFSMLVGREIGYDIAQINHYIVRDPASFALKKRRGRGHTPKTFYNRRHTAQFYRDQNHNDAVDTSILRWADAVAAQKETLQRDCMLTPELDAIQQQYQSSIRAIAELG